MLALSWRQVDFAGVVLAGLIAGYLMAIAGLWAGKVPGLKAVDIADFGRRYIVSDRPSAWIFGFVAHLANSVIFTYAWASLIVPNVPIPLLASALAWSGLLTVGLAGALVAPMSGMGFLGLRGGLGYSATTLVLHVIYGLVIGTFYSPQ